MVIFKIVLDESIHCTVTDAGSAEEALELLATTTYEIIFLDQKLPGKNGFEVFASIKKLAHTTPIISLTNYDSTNLAVSGAIVKSGV